MTMLHARPLTAEAFAPYGEVLEVPAEPGRLYYERGLATLRPGAWPSLSLAMKEPHPPGPLRVQQMERHEFSSQSFVPLGAARWLVLVAPHAETGGPDMARAQAFIAGPGQGVTYGTNVWHHPLTVFDTPARFAIMMWRDGTATDEEFFSVTPFLLDPG
ncbi:ureidoglycolate lyase [Roseomonas sp. GC11]|uniref:ureidoglycolate lyase n=1 Tax=Roseomonas sp. GC11 TaxID=2950546 RepID=UPI00210ECC32|nr:ureidoglycolate lyase [Roseomonas sp. GC11]MCQ4159040.1 ureidoglycolate lyase [Roseomonas sp. GC11]